MAEAESVNSMLQGAFQKIADGEYALQTAGASGGAAQTVILDQTNPNNKVRIADGQSLTVANSFAGRATSVFANGKQAAPAANTDIAVTADLATGTWDIEARISILATTVANVESTNVVFRIGGTTVATPTVNVPGTAGSTDQCVFRCRVNLGAATPVSVRSGAAAATAGSIYVADIVATKWENP